MGPFSNKVKKKKKRTSYSAQQKNVHRIVELYVVQSDELPTITSTLVIYNKLIVGYKRTPIFNGLNRLFLHLVCQFKLIDYSSLNSNHEVVFMCKKSYTYGVRYKPCVNTILYVANNLKV